MRLRNAFFAKRFKKELTAQGLSYLEFSVMSGLDLSAIGAYARGEKEPGIERLCLISIALGVSADYLIGADRELPDSTRPKIYKSDF